MYHLYSEMCRNTVTIIYTVPMTFMIFDCTWYLGQQRNIVFDQLSESMLAQPTSFAENVLIGVRAISRG